MEETQNNVVNHNIIQNGAEHKAMVEHIEDIWEAFINDYPSNFKVFPVTQDNHIIGRACTFELPNGIYSITISARQKSDGVTNLSRASIYMDCVADVCDIIARKNHMDCIRSYWIPDGLFSKLYDMTCKKIGYNKANLSDFAKKFLNATTLK